MNEQIRIDGSDAEWERKCWENAECNNPIIVVNFRLDEMLSICNAIAKKHGYELKGSCPANEPGVCHFIPRNYDVTKLALPDGFAFSGTPEG